MNELNVMSYGFYVRAEGEGVGWKVVIIWECYF